MNPNDILVEIKQSLIEFPFTGMFYHAYILLRMKLER